jgi:cell division protein FtsL
MAIATSSPERHSQLPARTPAPSKRQLRVVRTTPKQPRSRRPRAFYIGPALVLACLLGVGAAQAISMQSQVAITNLQSDLSNAQNQHYDLQLKVADEEQPSAVVSGAKSQGMVVPQATADNKKTHSTGKPSSTR